MDERQRLALAGVCGLAAASCDAVAMAGVVATLPVTPWQAACLHAVAIAACYGAARLRTELSSVEFDLVLMTATFLPGFGPALAWLFPRTGDGEDPCNAHALFEEYERSTRKDKPYYKPPLVRGDYKQALSRHLDIPSYPEVLAKGNLAQKRNLLRALAEFGTPQHFGTIRRCLQDDEPEIRLCAYAEIERASRRHERRIAELEKSRETNGHLIQLADAQHRYGISGLLDRDMAQYWLDEAITTSDRVLENWRNSWQAARIKALCLIERRRFDEAQQCLDDLSPTRRERPEVILCYAEIAFRRRDFASARQHADRLRELEHTVPEWLAALGGTSSTSAVHWD